MSQPVPPTAVEWWTLFSVITYVAFAAGAVVMGIMIWFIVKYRHRKAQGEPSGTEFSRGRGREAIITAVISSTLLISLAAASMPLTIDLQVQPPQPEGLTIGVTAFQFSFSFTYPNNVTIIGECRVPAETTVIFNVTSRDVMHNFAIPDFRAKIDAIPGRFNRIWITAPALNGAPNASYAIRCYELCGVGHANMVATLVVMPPAEFNQWLSSQATNSSQTATNMTGMGG